MPPKKQKLADLQSAPSPTSSPHSDLVASPTVPAAAAAPAAMSRRSRPALLQANSPKSPVSATNRHVKRARSEGVAVTGSSTSELPLPAASADELKDKAPDVAVTNGGGANADAGGGGGEKKKHFPFIYGNYSGYYGYRSPSVEDARLKVLVRSMFEGKRCLDIGCNAGELTVTIARRYAPQHILGVDIDGSLVRRARAHLAQVAKDASGSASAAREADAGQCDGGGVNPFVFPNNCGFRRENFVDTADADASYSVIMCLSTTKWIHFNWGDEGIKRLFKRVFNSLAPGGVFILEAQPFESYNKKKRRLSLEVRERVRGVTLKPEAFAEYLTSPNVAEGGGFKRMEVLGGVQGEEGKEFSRPMLAFFK